MFFAGLRGTGSFGADERPKNFREMILWSQPNGRAPLTALSAKMKTESVNDPEFSWWEEVLKSAMVYINDAANYDDNPATVAFTVDHGPSTHTDGYGNALTDTTLTGLQFVAGDLLMVDVNENPKLNEIVRVVSATATVVTVVRAVAGSTIDTIADNSRLRRIGSNFGEGSLSPETVTTNPVKFTNYCEIQKTAYQVTNTTKATKFRTGDALKNDKKRKMYTHAEKHEKAAIFGRPNETTDANGMPLRTMGGIIHYLTSHVTIFTVDPTEDTFMAAVAGMFDYDAGGAGNERVGFIGNGALMFLNKLVRDNTNVRINYEGKISAYGMELLKWTLPMGTVSFKSHPLFNTDPRYSYSMLFVNPAGIIRRPLNGRDTKDQKNIQPNDADYEKGQWIDEIGMEYHYETTMAYIGGFKDH